MVVNMSRARASTPHGTVFPARFVFHNGRAALWTEDRKTHTATRVDYLTDVTLHKPHTAREPMTVSDSDGQVLWYIKQERGGGCGCRSPLKNIPIRTLLDPDTFSV